MTIKKLKEHAIYQIKVNVNTEEHQLILDLIKIIEALRPQLIKVDFVINNKEANKKQPDLINILVVKGSEGHAVYINNIRIAGPKPWGGGTTLYETNVKKEELLEIINKES